MSKYGQFCPVARSLEILGDRWTLLIIRDMLGGAMHFNDLERGLPGISRALLAQRLRLLQGAGVVERRVNPASRQSTEYRLTPAGEQLQGVIGELMVWGEQWAFGEPSPEELDPVLLMWWMRGDAQTEALPQDRVVVQYDLRHGKQSGAFWLVLTMADVTLCLTDPGYDVDVLVTADVSALYKLWWGQISYEQATHDYGVRVEGQRRMVKAFPTWFAWEAAEGLRAVRSRHEARLPIIVAGD